MIQYFLNQLGLSGLWEERDLRKLYKIAYQEFICCHVLGLFKPKDYRLLAIDNRTSPKILKVLLKFSKENSLEHYVGFFAFRVLLDLERNDT